MRLRPSAAVALAVVAVAVLAGCGRGSPGPAGASGSAVSSPGAGRAAASGSGVTSGAASGARAMSGGTSGGSSGPDADGSSTGRAADPSSTDWPAYHGGPSRAGVSTAMPAASGRLRVIGRVRLDGAVYASPIVARGIIVVATENDTLYAFDSRLRPLWKRHLGTPSPSGQRPCGNIDPLGITGTPVYDASTGDVYVAPELSGNPPRHRIVAVHLTSGTIAWQRTLDLPGVDAAAMQERGALAIAGGRVFVPFGGLDGDCGAYKGRVVGYALTGRGDPVSYTVPTMREAGIWAPPGPSVDRAGHLFVAVGNGGTPASEGVAGGGGESGVGDRYDHSDSVLELSAGARLLDSFSPSSWASDNDRDLDLGSQGPALVGPWVFAAGKSGTAYVLRAAELGGIGGQVSSTALCRASFGGTAVVGEIVYAPCVDGLRAVRIDGRGRMHVLWSAAASTTGSPVVGGGRVWSLDTSAGVLHALDPGTGRSVAAVPVGAVNRFATPAIDGTDLLVPTLAGLVVVTARG